MIGCFFQKWHNFIENYCFKNYREHWEDWIISVLALFVCIAIIFTIFNASWKKQFVNIYQIWWRNSQMSFSFHQFHRWRKYYYSDPFTKNYLKHPVYMSRKTYSDSQSKQHRRRIVLLTQNCFHSICQDVKTSW